MATAESIFPINNNTEPNNLTDLIHKKTTNPKLTRIRRNLANLFEESTAHGIPRVFKTKRNFLKVMWLCFSIVSISLGVYMLIKTVLDFHSHETVSQVKIIYERPVLFPTLSFQMMENDELRKNFSFEDYVIDCKWNFIECNLNEFEKLHDEKLNQNYYKFNSGKDINGHSIPFKMKNNYVGFSITLFAGLPKEFDSGSDLSNHFKFSWGFYIHNSSQDQVTNTERPLYAYGGSKLYYKVKRILIKRLEEPYNNCIEDLSSLNTFNSTYFKFILENTKSAYRQVDCFDVCLSHHLVEICNISLPMGMSFQIHTQNKKDLACFKKYLDYLVNNLSEVCYPFCPLECNIAELDIKTYDNLSPTYEKTMKIMPKIRKYFPPGYNMTYQDVKNSIATIEVYYPEYFYTFFGETPKTSPLDLVSNIGGLLGLFIGQ